MRKIKTNLAGFLLFVLVASGSFITCEIGLGSSVDTKPPTVSIAYPPVTSVIKGSFMISGTSADETGLGSVVVTLRDITGGLSGAPLAGTWTIPGASVVNNTWQLLISNERVFNAETGELGPPAYADGKYSVTVEARDNAGRPATTEVTYFLDNTAPLVKIAQPSTTGATNATGARFGTNVTFKGDLWDAGYSVNGPCEKIVFDFFDYATGAKLTTYEKQNPGSLLDLTIDPANYAALVAGMNPNPTTDAEKIRSLSYTVTAYDYARSYVNPADLTGVAGGNTSTHFFLNNDLNALFYGTGVSPKLEALSKWDNDPSYTGDFNVITRSAFTAKRIPSIVTVDPSFNSLVYANLAVSPFDKSPVIDVAGLDASGGYDSNPIASQSNLSVKITPGPDGYNINTGAVGDLDTIRMRLTPEASEATPDPAGWVIIPAAQIDILGTNIIVNYPVTPLTGKFMLEIHATDKASPSQTALNATWKFAINAGAPQLESVNPINPVSPASSVKIRPVGGLFAVTVIGKDDQDLSITLTDSFGVAVPAHVSDTYLKTAGGTGERNTYTWTKHIPAPMEGSGTTISFKLNDGQFDSSTITRTFVTDTTGPALAYAKAGATVLDLGMAAASRIAPSYESIVEITGYADADLKKAKVHYTLDADLTPPSFASPDWVEVEAAASTDINPVGLTGTYRKFVARLPVGAAEGVYNAWYSLADDALALDGTPVFGTPVLLGKIVFDSGPPQFGVTYLHTTPAPAAQVVITESPSYKNVLYTIRGSVTDLNGFTSLTATKNDTAFSACVPPLTLTVPDPLVASTATTWTWSFDEPGTLNQTNVYKITATDSAGKTTIISRTVTYDTAGPTVNVLNLTNGSFISASSFTVTGTASDSSGIDAGSIEYTVDGGTNWLPVTGPGISWNHSLTGLTEGPGKTIRFRAEDSVGNETMTPVIGFGVDTLPPALTVTDKALYDATAQNSDFTLSGTASDANGIFKLEISTDAGNSYAQITTVPATTTDSTEIPWNVLVPIAAAGADDGLKSIRIRATDTYNKQTVESLSVRFDSAAPTVNVNNLVDGQLITATSFTVNGSWSDNGGSGTVGGLAKMQYKIGVAAWEDFLPAAGASSWTQTLTLSQGLNQTIEFQGFDYLGNVSSATSITGIDVDTALPATTVLHGASAVWTPPLYKSAMFSLNGTASDTLGVASVAITASPAANAGIGVTTVGGASGDLSRTWSVPITPTADGSYTYSVTVTDTAGRTTVEARTIIWDTTAPSITGITSPATDATVLDGPGYTFRGGASDAGSGVKTVRYSFDDTNWTDAAGTETWAAAVDLSTAFVTEGLKTIDIVAEDNAGRISASSERTFMYDKAIPLLTVTGSANRDVNGGFTLEGTASDTHGIASISITQDGIPISLSGPSGTTAWTQANLPRDPASIGTQLIADGTYVYQVTAIDLAGKASLVSTVTVRVDRTAPDVNTITAPGVGQTGLNALSGSSYIFRGTIGDAGVGPAKIWYVIDTNAAAPAIVTTPGAAGYAEVLTTGNWTATRTIPADIAEGIGYYMHVLAEDSSGNRTLTTSATSVLFDVDLANPVAVENSINTTTVVNRKATFSLAGTATDSHGIASVVVTQKLDDGATHVITPNGPSLGGTPTNRTWSLPNLPRDPADLGTLDLTDGLYEYVITVTDLAGKTHILTRTVRFDATGPTLAVTSPAAGSWVNAASVTVSGVASDLTGVKAIYYAQGVTEPALPADLTTNANWTGAGWLVATGTGSWSYSLTGLAEGSKRVWIRSLDTPLNLSAAQSLDFGVDLNTPLLTSSIPAASTRVGFAITGTSSDTNALAATAITVTQKKDAGAAIPITTNGPSTGDSWATWSLADLPRDPASIGVQDGIDSGTDGVYEYVITVTDVAGKTRQLTRTVRFDASLPTVVVSTDLTGWKGSPSLSVNGTAADTGSGVDLVEYSLDGTNWNALSGTATWSGNIPVASGTNTIHFRSRDAALNYSALNTHSVSVDLANPELTTTTPGSLVRVNGQSGLATEFHATDLLGSGVASVKIKIGSSDFSSPNVSLLTPSAGTRLDGTWNLTIPAADLLALTNDVQYVVYVQATDSVGNRTTVSFSILVDKVAPTVSIASPANGVTTNKVISVAGTAGDTQALASVLLEIQHSDSSWTVLPSGSFAGSAGYNWSLSGFDTATYGVAEYDTNGVAAGILLSIRATAEDSAANTTTVTRTFYVDQDSDRPTIRLSNIDTDGSTTLINVRTVSGVVLDDDGTVALADFEVSEDGSAWIGATANPVVGPANPLFYDVETRSFQYSPSANDGVKNLYFRVVDGGGSTFATPVVYDAGAVLTYPKILYSAEPGTVVGTKVSFSIDTNPPSIHSDIYFDTTSPYTFDGGTALDEANRLLSNTVFGGARSILALRVASYDAVGMNTVNINIAGTNYATAKVGNVATYDIFTTSDTVPIDVSALASGAATVTVTALDISGQTSTSSRQILIDNDDPLIDITSHVSNEQVTGDVVLRGTGDDGTGSGIDAITYRVGADLGWTPVTGTFAWNIYFTGANSITTTGSYANSTHATETSPGSNVWILPIQIRAVDRTGNETIETFYLNVNPDGDRPTVSVLYPSTGNTLGGTIRIFGSAQDNVSVSSVWMMIDADGDGDYDSTDVSDLTSYGYTVVGTDAGSWGFQVSGTASWSQSINGSGEFNPPGIGQRTIRFRVRARDNNGIDGTWSPDRTVYVDNNVPRIGSADPLRLVQYTDATFTAIAAERAYVSNMYIRGEWYLVGSVEDESGINAINVTGSDAGTLVTEPDWFVEGAFIPATSLYNYTIRIPVGKPLTDTSTGMQSYTIYVEDGSDPIGTATQPISLNYDNKPPVVDVPTHGGLQIDAANPIVQSNNTYTIASTATESGLTDSGFERLVFFFVRQGSTNPFDRVYNPMTAINSGQLATDVTGNRTYLAQLSWTAGDIPRLLVAGSTRSGEDSLTHASIVNNENIRVGGLVRIAGVDRLIKSVNRPAGNITFAPGANVSYTDASFAYGLVVDNTTIETGVWSGSTLTSITNDDGDGMIESVIKSGGSYDWDASINSLNIPDGPVELHYVAFDKAGNSVSGTAVTSVSNNRPRIARVLLGTDLSGDDAFSSTELQTYFTATNGAEPSLVNLASTSFIMKGRLAVIPEFVGGNGTLRYVWATNGAATDVWDGATYPTASFGGTLHPFTSVTLSDDAGTTYTRAIVVAAADTITMDDVLKLFSFAVWDETEETTQGSTSQWARINVPLTVDVVDGVVPVVAISPFFWTSAAVNSLYEGSKNNGHIEIGLNALGDTDPKVSGSVSIRGTAYDNQRLSALYAFIGANTGTGSTYAFTGTSTTKDFGGRIYARMATYDPGTNLWTGTDQWATNGWSFTVTPGYMNQTGHKVDWQLNINTARITNVAALNQLIRMVAEDRTPNASSETATPTGLISTNNVPGYQVDVVPYVSSVVTRLSTLKVNNPSVYNRTALGRYPVNSAETITINGFNLTGADVGGTTGETVTAGVVSVPMTTVPTGDLSLSVNGVTILNNSNSNAVEYNKQPNGDNNLLLTDDVMLDVWQFNNRAAVPISGRIESPVMKINPVSKMIGFAFSNGPLYYSMGGTIGATEYSYYYWQASYDFLTSIAFAYDSVGHTYGAAAGGDINETQADKFSFLTDRWGISGRTSGGSYGGVNALRMESIAQNNAGIIDFNKYRIKSPNYATSRYGGTTATNVYMAYYDDINAEIRFRYGNLADTATAKTNFGTNFIDSETTGAPSAYNSSRVSMIAGSATGRNPGEYLSIGVIPGTSQTTDVVVIVWYDALLQKLWYSYNTTPATDRAGVTNGAGWSTPMEIFSEAGEYCKLVVDSAGGIHIAAYDVANADLLYAHLDTYLGTFGATTAQRCVVDSYGIVGTNITLDTASTAGKIIPYIGYYTPSSVRPKYAYLVDTTQKAPAGVVNDEYTGAWEITLLPTASTVPQDHINVGVWKTAAGVLDASTSTVSSYVKTGSGYTAVNYGFCYGNGTSNGVLAYQIKESTNGFIETAQKR